MAFTLTPEQLRRAQVHSRLKQRRTKAKESPFHKREADVPTCPGCHIRYSVSGRPSNREGFLRWHCNYCGVEFYLLPGEKSLQPKKEKTNSGSGVIVSQREPKRFVELRRDPFEHRNLALLVHR